MTRKGLKKITLWFFIIAFAAIAAISLFQLISIELAYREGARTYDVLTQFVTHPPESWDTRTNAADRFPEIDFAALRAINPDIAAWLILEGTPINYPVVQGADNLFYLNHMFDGEQNSVGTLFIDSYNTPGFADQNTVIYGHNMRDASMFATLLEYESQAFFEEHSEMLLLTPQGNYLIKLFAGYTTDAAADSWMFSFADSNDFERWISEAKYRSDFTSSVEIHPSDRLVTLSTCSYAFDNARYVVVGRLVPIV